MVNISNQLLKTRDSRYFAIKTLLETSYNCFGSPYVPRGSSFRWTEKSGFFFHVYYFLSCVLEHLSKDKSRNVFMRDRRD